LQAFLEILIIKFIFLLKKYKLKILSSMGIGDWGFGDWGLGIGPNPQSPIPNPQSPIPMLDIKNDLNKLKINKN
jgi:hypothetical protein